MFEWHQTNEAGVRPVVIVVSPPCRDHAAGKVQRWERVLVQAILAHPSVEALNETVLHELSWRDIPSKLER